MDLKTKIWKESVKGMETECLDDYKKRRVINIISYYMKKKTNRYKTKIH